LTKQWTAVSRVSEFSIGHERVYRDAARPHLLPHRAGGPDA
jgi:hypothetical protein